MLTIGVEESVEELTIIDLYDVVCVCARATDPGENDKRRTRKTMVTTMYALISLPKPETFTLN